MRDDRYARHGLATDCPWCGAPQGIRCVNVGTGETLRSLPAHHARLEKLGLPAPEIDRALYEESRHG